jgi:hypothetical protein
MKRACLAVLLSLSSLAQAETGIATVVQVVESRYGVRHHGVPGLFLAKPLLIKSGTGGVKLEEFNGLRIPFNDSYWLRDKLAKSLGPDWHPFIEEWSKSAAEWSLIYTKANGRHVSMLIVTADQEDGLTAVQMSLSGHRIGEWLNDPIKRARRRNNTDGN